MCVMLSIVVSFPTLSEALKVGTYTEKYFFFRVQILMASDGCGLVELLFTLSCIFRIRVRCDDVSFPAPSEALNLENHYN